MASSADAPDAADVSIESSPRTPRPGSFREADASAQLDRQPAFVCTSFQARAAETEARSNAGALMTNAPPSFQEAMLPSLMLTVQISKTEEVLETVRTLRDAIPTECAVAHVALDRTVAHLESALRNLHQHHDQTLTLFRASLVQHSVDFGSVTDAKSLYDCLLKEHPSGKQDRKSAVEWAIIPRDLQETKSMILWVPHQKLPIDALTKEDPAKANDVLS
eukprot:s1348_g10.t1